MMSSWSSAGILENGESFESMTISVPLPLTEALERCSHFGRGSRC